MKSKFKKIMSICLSMALAFSLALPVYAGSAISGSISSNYEFDEVTGHLTIGKVIEEKSIYGIDSIPKDKIKSVTIRNGVTKVYKLAFEGCTSLTSINIPDSVTEIGWEAFSGCTGLASIVIPDSVTEIGWKAFSGCTGLASIVIPDSVTKIGWEAFGGCTSLSSINVNKENENLKSIDGVLFSKDGKTLLQFPIGKREANYAIPNSVESIGSSAFQRCTGLTSITIPDSVEEIDSSAFEGCTGLTSVTIPDSVTKIDNYAFKGCTGLTSVSIGNGVKEIGEEAFSGCTGLTFINIPDSVTSILDSAFEGCKGLTSITIPDSDNVTEIYDRAFANCTGLTSVTIGSATIGNNAFAGCTGLEEVILGNHVERIGYRKSCRPCRYSGKMARIYYKSFEDERNRGNAFRGCTSLSSINVNKKNENFKSIDGVLFSKDGTELILYPTGRKATNYTIPNSVTKIDKWAFDGCTGLTSITIPNSVTKIDKWAFADCTSLKEVTIPRELDITFSEHVKVNRI